MDFFKRFSQAFVNSKVEYEHSLPICNEKYEFLFFFDCTSSDGKCILNQIDNIYIRNIKDSTILCCSAKKILPEYILNSVIGKEIISLETIDEELDLEDKYYELYERCYKAIKKNADVKKLFAEIVSMLNNLPVASVMLNIYAYLIRVNNLE